MTVSVAMCTYNGAPWLEAQLASLAGQSRRPDELVACDDGSTDDTPAILERFAATAPFSVRIVRNPRNLGLLRNFEQAFGLAGGEVIFLCDQDDVWADRKIERMMQEFEASAGVGLVFCDARVVDPQLRPLGHTHWHSCDFTPAKQARVREGGAFEVFARHSFVAGATLAVAGRLKPAILPAPPPETNWQFDAWAAAVAAGLSEVRIVPDPLNDYRQHPRQALGGARKGVWRRYVEARRAVDERYHLTVAGMTQFLHDRLHYAGGLNIYHPALRLLRAKTDFSRRRARMRASLLARYPLLFRDLAAGNYAAHAQGWRSALMDAVL
jgi:hypothetical protein